MAYEFISLSERERITSYFLRGRWFDPEELKRSDVDEMARLLLGTDEVVPWPEDPVNFTDEEWANHLSIWENCDGTYFRYGKIFDLCRVIGAVNLYDIGCRTINQAFLLMRYSSMTYTGISMNGFGLCTPRPLVGSERWAPQLETEQAPPPFCEGRIRFIGGKYPDCAFDIRPNNIAIACYSFTMIREETEIRSVSKALVRDFDRVLFNIDGTGSEESLQLEKQWQRMDWGDFTFFPIGPEGFVFGTKYEEDIRRMKAFYPFADGRFVTGIDDSYDFFVYGDDKEYSFKSYTDWGTGTEDEQ